MLNRQTIIAGLIASMVMGMWEMVVEVFAGNGFWAAPVYIAATLFRDYQEVATPVSFALVPVVVGLMGHMMNSVVLGVVFAKLAPHIVQSAQGLIGLGLVYGVVVFAVMWFAVLPLVDPVMLRLNFAGFIAAHMMWGIALGLTLASGVTRMVRWRNAAA